MVEDRLINKIHIIDVHVVLMLVKHGWQFSVGCGVVVFGLVCNKLNLIHERLSLWNQVLYAD